MSDPKDEEKKPQRNPHRWFFVVVWIFIIAAIVGMWEIDNYFSPEMVSEKTLPEAVGK
jgi:hypothetical protein